MVLLGLALAACAPSGRASPLPPDRPAPRISGRFEFGPDTFAFRNLVRAHNPERRIAFANYSILTSRAANQFFRFARFAPDQPPVTPGEYTRLTRAVMAVDTWEPPRPAGQRVVIPGYADLHAFSRVQEAPIKAGLGSNVLSIVHWRTWRVVLPLPPGHQPRVARELMQELDAGRPAVLLITNLPAPDLLNHGILAYDYRRLRSGIVEFLAYDPNDPDKPLGVHFEPESRRFWAGPLPYAPPGRIRVFRLYTSPLL